MSRRSYAGGVKGVSLTASATTIDSSLTVNTVVGVPSGAGGPFAIVVGKGTANEEKMLASAASAGTIAILTRGYDGSTVAIHDAGEEVRMIGTSIDFNEANEHVNKTAGVHGLGATDVLVGQAKVQALVGKSMSGSLNTFSDLPISAMPEIDDKVDDEIADRIAGDAERYTKTEVDAAFATKVEVDTEIGEAIDGHEEAVDAHPEYLQHDGSVARRLQIEDVPIYSTARHGGQPLNGQTVNDGNPDKIVASLAVPAASGGRSGAAGGINGRLIMVTFNVKGFTTNGSAGDICRFKMVVDKDGETGAEGINLVGLATGDSPEQQTRLEGNILNPAAGMSMTFFHETLDDDAFTLNLRFVKFSGNPNPTLVPDDGYFQWAQIL